MVDALLIDISDFEFRVVKGEDITKYYNGANHSRDFELGSLGSSCMRHSEMGEDGYFRVYEDYCKMLILVHKTQDKIIGRAILWDAKDAHDSSISYNVMDRIYSVERVYSAFFKWAKENDYYRKRYQSYDNEVEFVSPTAESRDDTEDMNFIIDDIDLRDYDYVPYMDTMAWSDGSCLRNQDGFGRYEARDTDGGLYGYNRGDDCDDRYDDEDDDY